MYVPRKTRTKWIMIKEAHGEPAALVDGVGINEHVRLRTI